LRLGFGSKSPPGGCTVNRMVRTLAVKSKGGRCIERFLLRERNKDRLQNDTLTGEKAVRSITKKRNGQAAVEIGMWGAVRDKEAKEKKDLLCDRDKTMIKIA